LQISKFGEFDIAVTGSGDSVTAKGFLWMFIDFSRPVLLQFQIHNRISTRFFQHTPPTLENAVQWYIVASKTIFEDPHIGHSDDRNQHWNLGTGTCTPVEHSHLRKTPHSSSGSITVLQNFTSIFLQKV
jgi:hypothetical protein